MSGKYRARASVDSVFGRFDSESQRARFYELLALQSAGEIRDLRKEPIYVLSHYPRCVFTPDASYLEPGPEPDGGWRLVVEDVKPQGGAMSRDVYVRVCWLLACGFDVEVVRLLRKATPRARVARGWAFNAGWLVKEYGLVPVKKRRRAS